MPDTGGAAKLGLAGCGAAACRGAAAAATCGTEPREAGCGCAAHRRVSPVVCGGGGEAYGEADAAAEGATVYGELCCRGDGVCAAGDAVAQRGGGAAAAASGRMASRGEDAPGGVYVAGSGVCVPLVGLRCCGGCCWANGDKPAGGGALLPDVCWKPLKPFDGG